MSGMLVDWYNIVFHVCTSIPSHRWTITTQGWEWRQCDCEQIDELDVIKTLYRDCRTGWVVLIPGTRYLWLGYHSPLVQLRLFPIGLPAYLVPGTIRLWQYRLMRVLTFLTSSWHHRIGKCCVLVALCNAFVVLVRGTRISLVPGILHVLRTPSIIQRYSAWSDVNIPDVLVTCHRTTNSLFDDVDGVS